MQSEETLAAVPDIEECTANILTTIENLDIPNRYFLIGGANLVLRGLMPETSDVDILVDNQIIRDLALRPGATKGKYYGKHASIELLAHDLPLPVNAAIDLGRPHYPLNYYKDLANTDNVMGVPCLNLRDVIESKKALKRDKDIEHLTIVHQSLGRAALASREA